MQNYNENKQSFYTIRDERKCCYESDIEVYMNYFKTKYIQFVPKECLRTNLFTFKYHISLVDTLREIKSRMNKEVIYVHSYLKDDIILPNIPGVYICYHKES